MAYDGRKAAYRSWCSLRQRCRNPNYIKFARYGGRGIKCCARWDKFKNFLEDMGPRPEGTSIDRIDNDGDYEPGNCRWATGEQQARNRLQPNAPKHFITYQGRTDTIFGWARLMGLNRGTLHKRLINFKWPVGKALNTPAIAPPKKSAAEARSEQIRQQMDRVQKRIANLSRRYTELRAELFSGD